ncbi:MAG: hypothetical protein FWC41_09640 [Firmicutes bacterium]|nr:hypothetical protein [Bacillota bacterium]
MDEQRLIELIKESPNFIRKLMKFDNHLDMANFLRENDVTLENSEAGKLFRTIKYFELKDEECEKKTKPKKIPDKNLNVTGGVNFEEKIISIADKVISKIRNW